MKEDTIGEYFKSQVSKEDAGGGYRPRRSFKVSDARSTMVKLGVSGEIESVRVDKYGNSVYADHAGNVKNHAAEDEEVGLTPDISYQKKYNVHKTVSADGKVKAFVSATDDQFISGLKDRLESLGSGANITGYISDSGEDTQVERRVDIRSMDFEEMDEMTGAKYSSRHKLPVGKIRRIGSQEQSRAFDEMTRYAQSLKRNYGENKQEIDTPKKGIRIACGECGNETITMDMNFCPKCGSDLR